MAEEHRHRRDQARSLWLLVVLFRTVAVLFALQLGGVLHDALDVAAAVMNVEEEHERCPNDGGCDDCPAGCPNCHCANAMRLVVPEPTPPLQIAPSSPLAVVWVVATDDAPPRPELSSLYRPPRSGVLHSS
jgi:hypothetical protein